MRVSHLALKDPHPLIYQQQMGVRYAVKILDIVPKEMRQLKMT